MIDTIDSDPAQQAERRRNERSRLIIDVFFDGKDATGITSTRDISTGGFYMNTRAVLPEGSILLIRIPLRRGKQVVCNAEVIYSDPGRGVGVRFQGLTEESRALLENELEDV